MVMRPPKSYKLAALRTVRESKYRDGKKLSMATLAKEAEIDYTFLWKLETGRANASASVLAVLASALEVAPEVLYSTQ